MAVTLLIDDDAPIRSSLEKLAEEEGLELRTAGSWNEGLALFFAFWPDLVIADYDLPDSDNGLKLLVEFRYLRPSTRLLLLSGKVEAANLDKAESLGFVDGVVRKGSLGAAAKIIEEMKALQIDVGVETDWVEVAKAFVNRNAHSTIDLNELDDVLRADVEGG
jgi:DNA-binding NtrC family response regulator